MSTVQGSQGKVRESERLKDDGRLDVSDLHSLTLHPGGVIFRWWRPQRSSLEQKVLLQHYWVSALQSCSKAQKRPLVVKHVIKHVKLGRGVGTCLRLQRQFWLKSLLTALSKYLKSSVNFPLPEK